jgi:hypothetical protein
MYDHRTIFFRWAGGSGRSAFYRWAVARRRSKTLQKNKNKNSNTKPIGQSLTLPSSLSQKKLQPADGFGISSTGKKKKNVAADSIGYVLSFFVGVARLLDINNPGVRQLWVDFLPAGGHDAEQDDVALARSPLELGEKPPSQEIYSKLLGKITRPCSPPDAER